MSDNEKVRTFKQSEKNTEDFHVMYKPDNSSQQPKDGGSNNKKE